MPAFKTAGALTFDGVKIITFFKTIDKMFVMYNIIKD